MTDPDDDWGDLARELGVQKPATQPEALPESRAEHEPEAAEGEQEEFAEGLAEEPVAADDSDMGPEAEGDEAGESEGEAGGEEGAGEGQPGTGRKRRRRRRRRKKGGPEGGEGADAGIADEPAPSYQAAGRVPVAAAATTAAEPAEGDEGGDEAEVGGTVSPAEEDTAGEVLRELIATWNVPSWDEIISGLNR